MNGLLGMFILLSTIILALAVGVGLGHLCVVTVLHLMGHRSAAQPTPALNTAEVASGD